MCFKLLVGICLILGLASCNEKCNNEDVRLYGVWQSGSTKYYLTKENGFACKYLGVGPKVDTLNAIDSIVGTYKLDVCQKVISITQNGFYLDDTSGTYISKNINFDVWKFTKDGDSIIKVETPSTYLTLKRIKSF